MPSIDDTSFKGIPAVRCKTTAPWEFSSSKGIDWTVWMDRTVSLNG